MDTIQSLAATRKKRITEADPAKLVRDVRVVLHHAEELIKATAGDIREGTREARAKLAGALAVTRETCNLLEHRSAERARAADRTLRERPFQMVGVALGMGLAVGILLNRVLDSRN